MAIKINKTKVSDTELSSNIEFLDGVPLTDKARREAAENVGEFLMDSILSRVEHVTAKLEVSNTTSTIGEFSLSVISG